MAHSFLSHQVRDLTLGKPSMPWLPSSSTLRDALLAFHSRPDFSEISVWDSPLDFPYLSPPSSPPFVCIGKISILKILCFLASKLGSLLLRSPHKALLHPVSALLAHEPRFDFVLQIDPHSSLLEALNAIAKGAQNLVVPVDGKTSCSSECVLKNCNTFPPHVLDGRELCWLTHEDVLRFLIGSIGMFTPIHTMSIRDLGIIQTDIFMVGVDQQVSSCLDMIKDASINMEAVAVVDYSSGFPQLVGEISTSVLHGCNESAALALTVLSAAEFMEFAENCRNPSQGIGESVKMGLCKKLGSLKGSWNEQQMQDCFVNFESIMRGDWSEGWEESSEEDDEHGTVGGQCCPQQIAHARNAARIRSPHGAPIRCRPNSSLIAVIVQALAHRTHYVWVTKEDDALVGIVTFAGIIAVLSNHLNLRLAP